MKRALGMVTTWETFERMTKDRNVDLLGDLMHKLDVSESQPLSINLHVDAEAPPQYHKQDGYHPSLPVHAEEKSADLSAAEHSHVG